MFEERKRLDNKSMVRAEVPTAYTWLMLQGFTAELKEEKRSNKYNMILAIYVYTNNPMQMWIMYSH